MQLDELENRNQTKFVQVLNRTSGEGKGSQGWVCRKEGKGMTKSQVDLKDGTSIYKGLSKRLQKIHWNVPFGGVIPIRTKACGNFSGHTIALIKSCLTECNPAI